jgi:tetratricopeptide (TPR) repeat protein
MLAIVLAATIAAAQPQGAAAGPSASAATVQTIAALLERNDLAAAKAATDAALRDHPADPALHNFAGVIDAQQGATDRAEAHFRAAIRFAPRATGTYLNLGRLLLEHGAEAKALDVYRQLLAIEPTNVEALYQAAFLLARAGQFGESRALVERMPDDARGRPQALAVLVADFVGVGDNARAAEVAAKLASHAELTSADVMSVLPAFDRVRASAHDGADVGEAILKQLLEALDKRGLASADALQQLAAIHTRHARYAEARQLLERAAAAAGAAAAGGPTVPLLMDLARVVYKSGDAKGALGYLAHARDLDPRNAGIHFFFGMACIDLNLGAEAYESLKKAIALDPENPFINYALGAVSIQRHDPSEALPYFEKYVRLKPQDPRGRFALGAARFYSNQLEAARDDLQQAASHPETTAGAHYFLGRIARQLNDLDTARRELDQALQANSQYADAWAELGLVQTRSDHFTEAEVSLSKALAIDPQNYPATFNLSTLYSKTKDPRRDEQAARLAALQQQRAVQAQEFLRIVEVSPY